MVLNKLLQIIKKFKDQKILVMGDLILDEYVWGSVERISPEAPVPVVKVQEITYRLGGAANVANNLSALGVRAELFGVVGGDDSGERLKKLLTKSGISARFVVGDKSRPTTVKTRVVAKNHQIVRVDKEDATEISKRVEAKLDDLLEKESAHGVSVIIIADYAKGVASAGLIRRISGFSRQRKIKVLVDPVPSAFYKYHDCYLIKPNKAEAERIAGLEFGDDLENLKKIMHALKRKYGGNIIVTLGEKGLAILDESGVRKLDAHPSEVFDVTGAGDTVMAGAAAALSAGATLSDAVFIGNICASVVVEKLGTAACSQEELVRRLKEYE